MMDFQHELSDVVRAGALIARCNSLGALQAETLNGLDRLIGVGTSMFFLDPEQSIASDRRVMFNGVDSKYSNIFHERHQNNPLAIWARKMKPRWNRSVSILSATTENVRKSPFFEEFMRPTGMHHIMAIGFVKGDRYLGLVGISRPENEEGFNDVDIAKAEALALLIGSVIERVSVEEKLVEMNLIADALAGQFDVVVDAGLNVRFSTAAAREVLIKLEKQHECQIPAGRIALPAVLLDRLEEFATLHWQSSMQFVLDTPRAGYKVGVTFRKLSSASSGIRYVINLSPDSPTVSARERLSELGLTRREIDIVNAVGSGLTTAQISDELSISYFTVQTHLKSIYSKLRVHNKAGLVSAILRS